MKPIKDYKEVIAVLNMFYDDDAIQVTYAHPYEFPYVISVLIEKTTMSDLRLISDLDEIYGLKYEAKQMDNKVLMCFYQG